MLVSRISPAPAPSMRAAHSTASSPVGVRPPCVNTSQPHAGSSAARRRASIATTTHCDPKRSAASRTEPGRATAAVLIDTLSAPALSSARTSSTVRTPPPTVSGMKTRSAVRATTSRMIGRSSCEAVMSRKVSSSAPSAS